MEQQRITILGANSFLARNLIHQLNVAEGCLFLYDIHDFQKDARKNYKKIDFGNREEIKSKVNLDVDLIYIFIGLTGTKTGFSSYEKFIAVNEIYLLNVLSLLAESKSHAKVIYPSSRLIYESSNVPIRENCALAPLTIYAVTKIASENYLRLYSKVFKISYTIFRIGVPYGTIIDNAQSYGTYEFFTTQAKEKKEITLYGDGSSRRTFTYIGDICKIMTEVPLLQESDNEIFNIGGDSKTLLDIAKFIAEKYGAKIKFVKWPELDAAIEMQGGEFESSKLARIYPYDYETLETYYRRLEEKTNGKTHQHN